MNLKHLKCRSEKLKKKRIQSKRNEKITSIFEIKLKQDSMLDIDFDLIIRQINNKKLHK